MSFHFSLAQRFLYKDMCSNSFYDIMFMLGICAQFLKISNLSDLKILQDNHDICLLQIRLCVSDSIASYLHEVIELPISSNREG